jgi:type I restriction enzyme S subunit
LSIPKRKLGELGEFRNGLNYSKENFGTGLKVISVKDFGDRWRPDLTILDEINPAGMRVSNSNLQRGDIIFVRSNGNKELIGRSMLIEDDLEDVSFSGFCIRFRPNNPGTNSRFLSLFFRTSLFRRVLSQQGKGTNINNLNQSILERMVVPFPIPLVQDRITEIASSYDDLIENNRRRIGLLEQAARLLYREWFLHLRFPGHEHAKITNGLPEGWERRTLVSLAEVVMGQSPKSQFYNDVGNGLPFHQGVTDYGFRFVGHRTFSTMVTKIAEAGDILVSVRAPVGRINVTRDKIVLGRGLSAIRSRTGNQSFMFYALKNHFYAEDIIGSGAIYAATNKKELEGQELIVPSSMLLTEFEAQAGTIDVQIANLTSQNEKLAQARDILLPRLMNGEIAV